MQRISTLRQLSCATWIFRCFGAVLGAFVLQFLRHIPLATASVAATNLSRTFGIKLNGGARLQQYSSMLQAIPWDDMPGYQQRFRSGLRCAYRSGNGSKSEVFGLLLAKSGSSTIANSKVWKRGEFVVKPCHNLYATRRQMLTAANVFRFSVVRDPFDRFVSAFNQVGHEAVAWRRKQRLGFWPEPPIKDERVRFKRFLSDVVVGGLVLLNIWTAPQVLLLMQKCKGGKLQGNCSLPSLNYLISLDELDVRMPELRRAFGLLEKDDIPRVSYPGPYGKRLSTADALDVLLEDAVHVNAFCDFYSADYVLLGFRLPDWCALSPKNPSENTTLRFLTAWAIRIHHQGHR